MPAAERFPTAGGGDEFAGETSYDSNFTTAGVVYFASSGDQPGMQYPAASPDVVAAGGTTTARNASTANFLSERARDLAGSGLSAFEARPVYQNVIQTIVGNRRGVPDLSFDSNPVTGAWVFDSTPVQGAGSGWFIVGRDQSRFARPGRNCERGWKQRLLPAMRN
jgi:kumamolisin